MRSQTSQQLKLSNSLRGKQTTTQKSRTTNAANCMDFLQKFLKYERMSIWELYIQPCMTEMLPYLAASGHNLYSKCIHIYLQFDPYSSILTELQELMIMK